MIPNPIYLLERGAEALSLTQEGVPPLRLMRTRFPRRERSNEREAPGPPLLLPV